MNSVIIRGRSIDGTVFLTYVKSHHAWHETFGWTSDAQDATRLSPEEAEGLLPRLFDESRQCAPDAMIGRLSIITAPRRLSFLHRWWRDVRENVEEGEYVCMAYGSLVGPNYEPGPQPTRVGLYLIAIYQHSIGQALWAFNRLLCKRLGHRIVDESYGNAETGCVDLYCSRCGFSHHETLY